MSAFLDESVKNVTTALKQGGFWDKLLLVFFSDNGGAHHPSVVCSVSSHDAALDTGPVYAGGAATNYPMRGGKISLWNGGVRVNAFVAGGMIPEAVRGQTLSGLVHGCDWYATLLALARVDDADPAGVAAGLPAPDGIDQWPYISGAVGASQRTEVPIAIGNGGCIVGHNCVGAGCTGCTDGAALIMNVDGKAWKLIRGKPSSMGIGKMVMLSRFVCCPSR